MENNNIVSFPGNTAARANQAGRQLIPSRFRDARRAKRMTQEELGSKVGVSRQAISSYEAGDKTPEPSTFLKLTEALDQPTSFFTKEDLKTFGDFGPRFFRKSGPETVRRNDACTVLGEWFVQIASYLDDYVNYPPVNLMRASASDTSGRYSLEEIEEIADAFRRHCGLGPGPISNVAALLESKGVAICHYQITEERIDAFSFWNGNRPFIFMASERESGARVRFDLAHELGHLILHRWIEPQELLDPKLLKVIESEADRFASAFLLPRSSFPNEVFTARLDAFVNLKRRWGVSIQALVYRCRDLELIDDAQFTNLYKQISFRKWRKKEPLDDPKEMKIENPKLLRRAIELVLESGKKHPEDLCAEMAFNPSLIETFCNLPQGTLSPRPTDEMEPSLKE
ncbi:MAG: ImmA/IrrE family metallo-endopeptidase [Rhodospirillaceae bacterium]|nr:ImmA/IrrE family metallo-endopeptidase [Rhodospirillales bacterium]